MLRISYEPVNVHLNDVLFKRKGTSKLLIARDNNQSDEKEVVNKVTKEKGHPMRSFGHNQAVTLTTQLRNKIFL